MSYIAKCQWNAQHCQVGSRETNARALRLAYYLSLTPNQGYNFWHIMLSYLDYAASFFLTGTCQSVQLFQLCFLCGWFFNLLYQFSSIVSSMIPSEESCWWSWLHPGPLHTSSLYSLLLKNKCVGEHHSLSIHAHTWEYACQGNKSLSISISISKKTCVFLSFLHVVLPISWKSSF